jgi:proteasome lid subunit RPN8/RPN11
MLTFEFEAIERIRRQVELFPLLETGGLLAGGGEWVSHALPANNETGELDVARSFRIGPEQMAILVDSIEAEGLSLIGSYHSHPNGTAQMSTADALTARGTGPLLLVAPGSAWEWKLWDPAAAGEVQFAIAPPRS